MARILIVEDDPDIGMILSELLESEGYETRVAADGQVALEVVEDDQPDLIVLDLMLPVVDGMTARSRLSETLESSSIPVIAMSASTRLGEYEKRFPMDNTLRKPFDLNTIISLVSRLLERPSYRSSERRPAR